MKVLFDEIFLEHKPRFHHPESPARLQKIMEEFKELPVEIVQPEDVSLDLLSKVHDPGYIDYISSLEGKSIDLDPDTYFSPLTYKAALKASGACSKASDIAFSGEKVFALVRPPGHHATTGRAMGFCIFNNIAVAAERAIELGARRVLIVDFDVHHGNGTQNIFWERSDVLYFSTHRYPFYPGTGWFREIGARSGKGFTVNVPLPGGMGDSEYSTIFEEVLVPVAEWYKPDIILVSTGFDSHREDPLADMDVTEDGFAYIAWILRNLAEKLCSGRLVFCLEGGYNLNALASSVRVIIEVLLGERGFEGNEFSRADVSELILTLRKYHNEKF